MVMIQLQLPDDLEEKARAAGLLTSEKIVELIEAELERQRQAGAADALHIMDELSANLRAEYAHLSEEEALDMLDQWIDEARAERSGNERDSDS